MEHEPLPQAIVSRETWERLHLLEAEVRRWSATLNLVSRHDLGELFQRHIADSVQLLPLLPTAGAHIDLGSGAGFPGLVLAIAGNRQVHLVEADRRKAAFLREAARLCGADVVVHAVRIGSTPLEPASVVTARALAPLDRLLGWAAPLLAEGGCCVFPKGRTATDELTQAARQWHMRVRHWQSRTRNDAVILQISEIAPHARPEH